MTAATAPDATGVYALGSNPAESARLQRQSDELRRKAPSCWAASASNRGRARLISAAGRAGSWICSPPRSFPADAWSG